MARLRILTLNCWNVSSPYEERVALIRAGIAALAPDVIGLQEIIVRRDGFDMGAEILHDLGYASVFGAAFRWNEAGNDLPCDGDGDAFGNLIASRWPIESSKLFTLPGVEVGERRSVIAARSRRRPDGCRSSPRTSPGSSSTASSASVKQLPWPRWRGNGRALATCRRSSPAT